GRYLYDPDPAVVRAGLVTDLARSLAAWQFDEEIAYLSADALQPTPLARALLVEESLPFHLGRLRELLRSRGVGVLNVWRRGSAAGGSCGARGGGGGGAGGGGSGRGGGGRGALAGAAQPPPPPACGSLNEGRSEALREGRFSGGRGSRRAAFAA